MPEIPKIENIHQRVNEAINEGENLNMNDWHQNEAIDEHGAHCGTTHCRAGWVVALAGKEGRELEKHTTTEFAAMQIYKASSEIHVSPVRFYESKEKALSDIKRCAELESNQTK